MDTRRHGGTVRGATGYQALQILAAPNRYHLLRKFSSNFRYFLSNSSSSSTMDSRNLSSFVLQFFMQACFLLSSSLRLSPKIRSSFSRHLFSSLNIDSVLSTSDSTCCCRFQRYCCFVLEWRLVGKMEIGLDQQLGAQLVGTHLDWIVSALWRRGPSTCLPCLYRI